MMEDCRCDGCTGTFKLEAGGKGDSNAKGSILGRGGSVRKPWEEREQVGFEDLKGS